MSEWFGHTMYPSVVNSKAAIADQSGECCPFLTVAKAEPQKCIKAQASRGVCTISSPSNGQRQNWLVCPYRAMEPGLMRRAIRRLFGFEESINSLVIPAIQLTKSEIRRKLSDHLGKSGRAFIYFDEKLGGELSIPATPRSPEFSFDVTVIEVELHDGEPRLGRFGVIEIQTVDFHGSYRTAVQNLTQNLRMYKNTFAEKLNKHQELLSENIEAPNIANVFKRTFYQMMFKFQLGKHDRFAGCVLAIPNSVWDSWQRHLGQPKLAKEKDGTFSLFKPGMKRPDHVPAWIYVFDIDTKSSNTPAIISDISIIATDAPSFSYFALEVAPEASLSNIGSSNGMIYLLEKRLSKLWPELAATLTT